MKFTVEKDTIVEGINCRVIVGENGRDIVYEKNGCVYYYFMNKFRKIYDFNVKAGDVVEFEFKTTDAPYPYGEIVLNSTVTVPCEIEYVTTRVIDGITLREISAAYTIWGSEQLPNIFDRHVYIEKAGITSHKNIVSDGIFPVCPERYSSTTSYLWFHYYQDRDIEYRTGYWGVGLKLKPQTDASYLATEDPKMIALQLKYNVRLNQSAPGAINPENLLYYTLRGVGGSKRTIINAFFATGKFDEDYFRDSRPTFPSSSP